MAHTEEVLKEQADSIKKLEERVQQLQGSLERVYVMQRQMAAEMAATRQNARARVYNSRAGATEPLEPLVREKPVPEGSDITVGSLPPDGDFPATRDKLLELESNELDKLARFYDEEFRGNTVTVRRRRFGDFIGVPEL